MFELVENEPQSAVIKVIGVGGAGGNAVQHMVRNNVQGVEFIAANTDAQALKGIEAKTQLQIGGSLTKGLGAGADPNVGRQAALDDRERISAVLQGADMVFITAGMGGGTGTGAAPIVAEIAKELGILTVAVVTKPFRFEMRSRQADAGIAELVQHVDSLITIPNQTLLQVLGERTTMLDAFAAANDVLLGAVQGIADLIIRPGVINVDFADVRTVMSEMGIAMMGTGRASGENRARIAAEAAIHSPLLEDIDLSGARGILVNVTAGPDLSLGEFEEVGETIEAIASPSATVVVGTVIDPEMSDELRVTVVATGIGQMSIEEAPPRQGTVETRPRVVLPAQPDRVAPDYGIYDRPAVTRVQSKVRVPPSVSSVPSSHTQHPSAPPSSDLTYLDIPAFLRRQAD